MEAYRLQLHGGSPDGTDRVRVFASPVAAEREFSHLVDLFRNVVFADFKRVNVDRTYLKLKDGGPEWYARAWWKFGDGTEGSLELSCIEIE